MTKESIPALDEKRFSDDKQAWCEAYVHVWSDLSRGVFDKAAVEKSAEEHWERSPASNPVEVAVLEFLK